MLAVLTHAVRALFVPAAPGCDAGWNTRFLPPDLADYRHERDDAHFNTRRDFCW